MSNVSQVSLQGSAENDPVSNVLKWSLLLTAIISFLFIPWGTFETYKLAPPLPQKFLSNTDFIRKVRPFFPNFFGATDTIAVEETS